MPFLLRELSVLRGRTHSFESKVEHPPEHVEVLGSTCTSVQAPPAHLYRLTELGTSGRQASLDQGADHAPEPPWAKEA